MKFITSESQHSTPKKTQDAPGESVHHFRELAEHARDAFWLVEIKSLKVLYRNPAFASVFGESACAEPSAAGWSSRCHADDVSAVQACWDAVEKNPQWNLQYRIAGPDGEVRWIHERSFPVCDQSGVRNRVAGISEDVTDEKLAQGEVERYQRQVQELTSRLDTTAETERQQVAEILHDDIGQTLALMRMQLGRLRGRLTTEMDGELDSVMGLLRTTINSTRSLMLPMSPAAIEPGFWGAVDALATELNRQTGIQIDLDDAAADLEIRGETATVLYRIVRELLCNAIRHAKTDLVRVRRSVEQGMLAVRVEDEGTGFDPSHVSPKRLGLTLSVERARMLGGSLEIDSASGRGTRVTVSVPIRHAGDE